MKLIFLATFITLSASMSFAEDPAYEAGSDRSEKVALDKANVSLIEALSKQPNLNCRMEKLEENGKTLVGFFSEGRVSKFIVHIDCKGSEQMKDQVYSLIGTLDKSAILIDSLERNVGP